MIRMNIKQRALQVRAPCCETDHKSKEFLFGSCVVEFGRLHAPGEESHRMHGTLILLHKNPTNSKTGRITINMKGLREVRVVAKGSVHQTSGELVPVCSAHITPCSRFGFCKVIKG
jgi:hypothetical protein